MLKDFLVVLPTLLYPEICGTWQGALVAERKKFSRRTELDTCSSLQRFLREREKEPCIAINKKDHLTEKSILFEGKSVFKEGTELHFCGVEL